MYVQDGACPFRAKRLHDSRTGDREGRPYTAYLLDELPGLSPPSSHPGSAASAASVLHAFRKFGRPRDLRDWVRNGRGVDVDQSR